MKFFCFVGLVLLGLATPVVRGTDHHVRVVRQLSDLMSMGSSGMSLMKSMMDMLMPKGVSDAFLKIEETFASIFSGFLGQVAGRRRRSYEQFPWEQLPFKFQMEKYQNRLSKPMAKPTFEKPKKTTPHGNPYVNFTPDMQDGGRANEEEGSKETSEDGSRSDWKLLMAGIIPQIASS